MRHGCGVGEDSQLALGLAIERAHNLIRADLACRAPECQLLEEDETNRCVMISVRFGLKVTQAV